MSAVVLEAALLALVLVGAGAHAVAPWQVAGDEHARRRWSLIAPPLLLAAGLAALLAARARPDAALAAGLLPLLGGREGRLLAVLFPAVLAFDLLAVLARGRAATPPHPDRPRLSAATFRIGGALGLALLAATSLAAELLRVGEGPSGGGAAVLLAAACRFAVGLGAGEVLAPRRPLLALVAGLALPAWLATVPPELRGALQESGALLTLAAAAFLFLAARFLPARLRRPALAGAALLSAVLFVQATDLSQALAAQPLPPLPPMPAR